MSKRFTLEEAQSLLPQIEKLMREAVAVKSEYGEAEASMESLTQKITALGGVLVNQDQALEIRTRRDRTAGTLKKALESIQEFGCVVKDLDIGLVDFPTLFRGEEVYLCWRMGERAIGFWHGIHEGFAGRKQIDQDFLEHHQGDPPN
jgi:hypothetical protein